ncbi:MAG: SIMPL domain-containing protein [Pseudomonadota bacterium]|nr:SIMPL domain-containing protein [Pseudomonadota bacterium]
MSIPPASWAAEELAPPQGVLSLTSSASVEVPRDLLTLTFATSREGPDAATVQSQLKQALDAALTEARRVARPGEVEVQTGNFSLSPRYVKGLVNGWQGSTELIVEGRDMAAIGQLSGRVTTLTIARVGYAISRSLRERTEADASTQAIARYRAKAADYARAFGYAGFAIREVNVSANDAPPTMRPMPAGMVRMASVEEALPVEAGKGTVTVTVQGTVQMTR